METEIRAVNVRLGREARLQMDRNVRLTMDRFGGRIRRLVVSVSDVNGPRGGIDKRCRIIADLGRAGAVVAGGAGETVWEAAAAAAGRLKTTLVRMLESRRDLRRRHRPDPRERHPAA